jgi:hypothetical protein
MSRERLEQFGGSQRTRRRLAVRDFDGHGWTASSPLQVFSGPDGPLQAGVPGFGAVHMGYLGAVYVNRR